MAQVKLIRDPEFAVRMGSACDAHPHCPPLHKGRLAWVQAQLKQCYDESVSVETVRKWMAGEARPRPEKVTRLADLLHVDEAWLSIGVDKGMAPRELKAQSREIEGAVNVVAGLIELDGGHAAFASPTDQERGIDIHAIIRGAKYDFHVSMLKDGFFRFPANHEEFIIIGIVKSGFSFDIFELDKESIDIYGKNRGGIIEMHAPIDRLRAIQSFSVRI